MGVEVKGGGWQVGVVSLLWKLYGGGITMRKFQE